MKLPIRLENAITKLYTAFHNGTLNAMDCKACAVGNICNNSSEWAFSYESNSGYLKNELINIESIFMHGYDIEKSEYIKNNLNLSMFFDGDGWDAKNVNSSKPDLVFISLCAVVEYLCELDKIPNVMDYTKLFETENEKPKYQLN